MHKVTNYISVHLYLLFYHYLFFISYHKNHAHDRKIFDPKAGIGQSVCEWYSFTHFGEMNESQNYKIVHMTILRIKLCICTPNLYLNRMIRGSEVET